MIRQSRTLIGVVATIVLLGSVTMGLAISKRWKGQPLSFFSSNPTSCPIVWNEIEPIISVYLESAVISASTVTKHGGEVFSTEIFQMAHSVSKFETLSLPDCANNIRTDMISGMNKGIDGFTPPVSSCVEFSNASQYLNSAYKQLIQEGIQADERLRDMSLIWGCDSPVEE